MQLKTVRVRLGRVKRKRFTDNACPIARTLDVVGEWWSLLVVREAFLGRARFEEFLTSLGIARNILAARLATLTERGVLERRPYQDAPPRHEYVLTPKGRSLGPVLAAMIQWGTRWELEGRAAVQLVDTGSGDEVDQVFVSARTGRRVDPARVRPAVRDKRSVR